MTPAVIDKEKMDKLAKIDLEIAEQNIERFVDAIEADGHLELLGTNDDRAEEGKYLVDELFVLKDKRFAPVGSEAYPKIEVREVIEKCTTSERAKQIIAILKGDKSPVALEGVTRIVGYYSRVNNWNKSKIGELRDRGNGRYGLTNEKPVFQEERQKVINKL